MIFLCYCFIGYNEAITVQFVKVIEALKVEISLHCVPLCHIGGGGC